MIKIYIDCTSTYRHNLNTGIQRVVRNITAQLLQAGPARGIQCVPVVCANGVFSVCNVDAQGNLVRPWYLKLTKPARRALHGVRRTLCWLLPFRPVYNFCYASHQEFGLLFLAHKALWVVRGVFRLLRNASGSIETIRMDPARGETRILLCADAGFTYLEELKEGLPALEANGTKIITVIYDLIPINFRQYCNESFSAAFEAWVRFAIAHSHGLVCISDAVRREVVTYLEQLPEPKPLPAKVDFFHLGFELDLASTQPGTDDIRARVFGDGRPVFVMVGTIEPRKNHEFVLRAFESLWRDGHEFKLCFIGRYGWNTGELIARLNSHPELDSRLFVLTDVADADLQYAYKEAHALICASLTEGFGLPIVEALAHDLPVLASDIPVFREIAGSTPIYFSPKEVDSLRSAVLDFCSGGREAAQHRTASFSPFTWRQSADMLLDKVLRLADADNKTVTLRPHESRTTPDARAGYQREVQARTKAL